MSKRDSTTSSGSRHSTGTGTGGARKGNLTPKRGLVEATAEDPVYWERTDRITRIERLFKPFGMSVCSHVLAQSLTHKGIARLVQKLGMSPRNMEDSDLTQVQGWLRRNGPVEFCLKVGIRYTGESTEVRKPTAKELETDGGTSERTKAPSSRAETSRASRNPPSTTGMSDNATPAAPPPRPDPSTAETSPVHTNHRSAAGQEKADAKTETPAKSQSKKPKPKRKQGPTPTPEGLLTPRVLPRTRKELDDTETGAPRGTAHSPAPRREQDPLGPVLLPRDRHRPKAPPPPRGLPQSGRAPTNSSAEEYIRRELDEEDSD